MKNYTKIFTPVLLAILIGSLTIIFAQSRDESGFGGKRPPRGEGFGPPPGHGGDLPPHIIQQLNLTSAQKEQIQTIESNSRNAGKEFFEKVKTSDEQLRTMMENGSFNEESARQILTAKAQAMTELDLIRLRAQLAILSILTTEQKAQLTQLKNTRPPFPPGEGFRSKEQ